MEIQKAKQLLESIYNKSINRQIPWSITESENEFQAIIAGYPVRIIRSIDITSNNKKMHYILNIYNTEGMLIDSFIDRNDLKFNLLDDILPVPSEKDSYEVMESIFERARSKALGGDIVLNEIINALYK